MQNNIYNKSSLPVWAWSFSNCPHPLVHSDFCRLVWPELWLLTSVWATTVTRWVWQLVDIRGWAWGVYFSIHKDHTMSGWLICFTVLTQMSEWNKCLSVVQWQSFRLSQLSCSTTNRSSNLIGINLLGSNQVGFIIGASRKTHPSPTGTLSWDLDADLILAAFMLHCKPSLFTMNLTIFINTIASYILLFFRHRSSGSTTGSFPIYVVS